MTSELEALRKVRQTRAFTDEPVTDEELEQLLEVARWTGSSRNTQPWHFIVIRDRELLDKVSRVRGRLPSRTAQAAPSKRNAELAIGSSAIQSKISGAITPTKMLPQAPPSRLTFDTTRFQGRRHRRPYWCARLGPTEPTEK